MKILLDIDGVMNKAASWRTSDVFEFDLTAVKSLKKIISETNATIILTTSHKHNYTLEEWCKVFKYYGIDTDITRLPDNTSNLSRKEEIMDWISGNGEDNYVIIDDDKSLNGLNDKSKLCLTSSLIGLTPEIADNAINILKNK